MLKHICVASALTMLGLSQAHAQPTPNMDAMFADQQLFRTCMSTKGNEGFCSCMFDVSNKNIKGAKFKKIWHAYLVGKNPNEAQQLRNQLTPAENQLLNGQLQAADTAQDACNSRFGIR